MQEKLAEGDACQVNSRHHQAVKQVACSFEVTATAPDGVIEAIECGVGGFCLGVQWHPENFWRTGEFRSLFEGFIEACRPRPVGLTAGSASDRHGFNVRRVREQVERLEVSQLVARVNEAS